MQRENKSGSLVSVIIPIYNVEDYVDKCVESVKSQTYSNLEIILIDDGSTDSSGKKCDLLALTDKRIHVIHQDNGGVSKARNAGIKFSKGSLISFVDADDTIHSLMIEVLYESLIVNQGDIATCGIRFVGAAIQKIEDPSNINNSTMIYLSNSALINMLYQRNIMNSPCAKLYRKSCINNVRFIENTPVAEDLLFNYAVFKSCKSVVANSARMYNYLKRDGSAMNSDFDASKMHSLRVCNLILKDSKKYSHRLQAAARSRLFNEAVYIAIKLPLNRRFYIKERGSAFDLIRQYRKSVLFDGNGTSSVRLRALMACISIWLIIFFFKSRSFVWHGIKKVVR